MMLPLEMEIRACRECPRCRTGTPTPGLRLGPQNEPGVLFLSAQPTYEDDLVSEPYSCRFGRILKKQAEKAGLRRVMYTYMVRCYMGMAPRVSEVTACHEWTRKEIADFAPRAIVLVGLKPLWLFFGKSAESKDYVGCFHEHPEYPGIIIAPQEPTTPRRLEP
jgi:uracil-DNA glycosylase family 4